MATLAALLAALGLGVVLLAVGVAVDQPRDGPASGPAEPIPSVAVIPFADLSPGQDQEFFSDGLAEEILHALAQVEGLKVAGRTSSFAFRGKEGDLKAIGRQLGVAAVLEGSVRADAGRVRVTAQLVKTADGFHLWSQTFEREFHGVFAVQDEIATAVVEALRVKLLAGRAPTSREFRTRDPRVYSLYLQGRQLRLATVELLEGRPQASLDAIRGVDEPVFRLEYEAMARHSMGQPQASDAALQELVARHAHEAPFQVASVHAWRGDADAAFLWLERALEQGDGGLLDLKLEPLFRSVLGDPRYRALLERLGAPVD